MKTAIRIWRALLWIFGTVVGISCALALLDTKYRVQMSASNIGFFVFCIFLSALSIATAVGINYEHGWARRVAWVAVAAQILTLPLFTPLGIFGLVMILRGAGKPTGSAPARPQRPSWARMVSYAVSIGASLVVLDALFSWSKRLGYPQAPGLISFSVILAVCLLLHVLTHEIGHALAVRMFAGHLHRFQIGPGSWHFESGRRWVEIGWKRAMGGSVSWSPGTSTDLIRQKLLIASAGPLADLACALTMLALFPYLGSLGWSSAWTFVMLQYHVSFLGFSLNLIPRREGYQDSDGGTILALINCADFRSMSEILLTQGMSDSSPLRPRDWPRAGVEWNLALEDVSPFRSYRSNFLLAGCTHYGDSGDIPAAEKCARMIAELAKLDPKRCSPNAFPEAVFYLAFSDIAAARDLWSRRPPGLHAQFDLAERLAEAAIAGPEDRRAAFRRAWECSALYRSSGTLDSLRDQLRRLEMDDHRDIGSVASLAEIVNVQSQAPSTEDRQKLAATRID